MKGHIFNLLEEFLIEVSNIDAYEEMLNGCSFSTDVGFISTVSYPDEHLEELVLAAVEKLGITLTQAHLSFGQWLFPRLISLLPNQRYTQLSFSEFLVLLDHIHVVELKKLYPDALPPSFEFKQLDAQHGTLRYRSERAMFDLVEGVLLGGAEYFGVDLVIDRIPQETDARVCDFVLEYHAV